MMNSRDMKELHPCLQRGGAELIRRMKNLGYAVLVTCTYRDEAYQNKLYAQGRTTEGAIVTNARAGQSMHNYRLAFDICENKAGREYANLQFFEAAGKIWEEMGGVWGGHFKSITDRPHFEFSGGLTVSKLLDGQTLSQSARMKWEEDAFEKALAVLVKKGVVNSPAYWREARERVFYLDELLRKAAEMAA